MKSYRFALFAGAVALVAVAGSARAQGHLFEVSVLGGVQELNRNDTAIPDRVVTLPATASLAVHFNKTWAAVGELTWVIPLKQSISLRSGASVDRKAPDMLAYQANLRGSLPLPGWTPYLTCGVGAMTLLQSTDLDRFLQVPKSVSSYAINFGGGALFPLNDHWGIRGDIREFAAFPSSNAQALSIGGTADAIWMERGAVGVTYSF